MLRLPPSLPISLPLYLHDWLFCLVFSCIVITHPPLAFMPETWYLIISQHFTSPHLTSPIILLCHLSPLPSISSKYPYPPSLQILHYLSSLIWISLDCLIFYFISTLLILASQLYFSPFLHPLSIHLISFCLLPPFLCLYLKRPDRQSATVGILTYFVRATRRAHFRMWLSTNWTRWLQRKEGKYRMSTCVALQRNWRQNLQKNKISKYKCASSVVNYGKNFLFSIQINKILNNILWQIICDREKKQWSRKGKRKVRTSKRILFNHRKME